MSKFNFVAYAFVLGAVLGGCFGSMPWGHTVQGASIGAAVGLLIAALILKRESDAKGT
jgi:uncharacterized transporter YbjL